MKDKKNIDELFRSQMGDYHSPPPPEVWNRIEAQLKKKEDRKVIPLWFRIGGVAALLALLLMVGNILFTSNNSQPLVTEDPALVNPMEQEGNTDGLIQNKKDALTNTESPSEKSQKESIASDPEVSPTIETEKNGKQLNQTESSKKTTKGLRKESVINGKTKSRIAEIKTQDAKNKIDGPSDENPLWKESTKLKESGITRTEDNQKDKTSFESREKQQIESDNIKETGIAKEETAKENGEKKQVDAKKKSIFDAIEEGKKEAVTQLESKPQRGWEVTPNVGPVYYNSVNGGSSIDPTFADNSQTGEVNFSYGVHVAYVVNDRLSVRTGINNVSVGYATGGIEVASGPIAFGLKSVNYDAPGRNVLTVFDKGTLPNTNIDPNDPYAQLNLKSTSGNAELRESITYYEIPLEAKYALINKRFGINMIGGFSTLLLGDSEVSVNDNGFRSVLGEANNLNSVSFSTNIGLGFDYKISKRFKLNIEPIFKYQLNPYSDSSVDFNPYYFGIYSGFSFKF